MTDSATFSDLVREAFIDPLRSVLIVDDQYPTWEEILNSKFSGAARNDALESRSTSKAWVSDPNDPLKIIREFRSKNPGFVIDIHDAPPPPFREASVGARPPESPSELAGHLHQSDLLVLDYNLEGDAGGLGGEMARKILRSVLSNKHFNLIIVHTGEDNLSEVMADCLISLMNSCTSQFDSRIQGGLIRLDEHLDALEAEDKFDRRRLAEVFSMQEYLECRKYDNSKGACIAKFMRGEGQLSRLHSWGAELCLRGGYLSSFLFWAIREFEKIKKTEFADHPLEGLNWQDTAECKWLRTSRGFVTFVTKGPKDLLAELQKALENWKPTPSRLLSAKYRHALNSIGVEAEDKSLENAHVFAQFYQSISESTRLGALPEQVVLSRETRIKEHVGRQSEAIAFLIEDELVRFGEKIIQADAASGNNFSGHYGVDLSNQDTKRLAVDHYNSYISTLPRKIGRDQLDSGHIFKLRDTWWVCATPACDLQPGQSTIAFTGSSTELRPFTAVQLVQMGTGSEVGNDHINSGSLCFIHDQTTGDITRLGIRTIADETKPGTQKVTWRMFIARDQGLICDGICKIIQPKLTDTELKLPEVDGLVMAKLRYEYALNYIQRVGSSVSRIGLGYAAYPSIPDLGSETKI